MRAARKSVRRLWRFVAVWLRPVFQMQAVCLHLGKVLGGEQWHTKRNGMGGNQAVKRASALRALAREQGIDFRRLLREEQDGEVVGKAAGVKVVGFGTHAVFAPQVTVLMAIFLITTDESLLVA